MSVLPSRRDIRVTGWTSVIRFLLRNSGFPQCLQKYHGRVIGGCLHRVLSDMREPLDCEPDGRADDPDKISLDRYSYPQVVGQLKSDYVCHVLPKA